MILAEALELRSQWGEISLKEIYDRFEQSNRELNLKINVLVKEQKEQILALSHEKERNENFGRVCEEWMDWGVTLLGQLTRGPTGIINHRKVRLRVADLLLSTASQRRDNYKIELLRKQRRLLYIQRIFPGISPKKRQTRSLRPLIAVITFASRVRKL
jgi:hypothetical protein